MTVSILIFLPVVAAIAVLILGNRLAKHAALYFALAELCVTAYLLTKFVPDASTQFIVNAPWIPKMGIYFQRRCRWYKHDHDIADHAFGAAYYPEYLST